MGLILKHATAVAKNAHGKPLSEYRDKDGNALPKLIKYGFSWYEYADEQTMIEAKDELTHKEQLKVRNVERKTTARQAANTAALEAAGVIKPNAENDSQIRLKAVYTGVYAKLISKGIAPEDAHTQAREKASELLDEQWEDETEDE